MFSMYKRCSSSLSFSLSIRLFEPTVSRRVKEGGLRVVAGSKLSPPSARHCTDAVCMYNTSASLLSSVGCSGPSLAALSHQPATSHASHKKVFTSSSSSAGSASSAWLIDDGNKVGGLGSDNRAWRHLLTSMLTNTGDCPTSVNISQHWSTVVNLEQSLIPTPGPMVNTLMMHRWNFSPPNHFYAIQYCLFILV